MLKISLLFKKFVNFSEIFRVLFLYEHKHIGRFSNLHECTFMANIEKQTPIKVNLWLKCCSLVWISQSVFLAKLGHFNSKCVYIFQVNRDRIIFI